jgi:hypothetical protein
MALLFHLVVMVETHRQQSKPIKIPNGPMLLPLQAGTFDAKRAPTSLVPLSIGIGRACFPRQVIADVRQ